VGGTVTNAKPHYFANLPAAGPIDGDRKGWLQQRRHILEIEFVNGAVYRYLGVQVTVYRDLMSAESKARFYDSNIRKHCRSVLVRPRQEQKSRDQPPGSTQSYGATTHN